MLAVLKDEIALAYHIFKRLSSKYLFNELNRCLGLTECYQRRPNSIRCKSTHTPSARVLVCQTRIEQINQQLEMGMLDIDSNESTRSPSPPPIYGDNGQRLNTREVSMKKLLLTVSEERGPGSGANEHFCGSELRTNKGTRKVLSLRCFTFECNFHSPLWPSCFIAAEGLNWTSNEGCRWMVAPLCNS